MKKPLIIIEAHSPMSAYIVNNTYIENKYKSKFDGIWISSLSDSSLKCLPDNEYLNINNKFPNLLEIKRVYDKKIILDLDSGGNIDNFINSISFINIINVYAVVIEDKTGNKENSLLGKNIDQVQDDPIVFSKKIFKFKELNKNSKSKTKIFARIESLNLGKSIDDALLRADVYINSGADGIVIHSCSLDGLDVIKFAKKFKQIYTKVLLICIPTTFHNLTYDELYKCGFDIIIYANHLLRSSFSAMKSTVKSILENKRTSQIEPDIISSIELISLFNNKQKL